MVATVYLIPTKKEPGMFHRSPDCYEMSPSKLDPVGVTIDDLDPRYRPCLICYRDAPRVKVFRRRCVICRRKTLLPCEHNGGIQVEKYYPYRTNADGTTSAPFRRKIWVWPENSLRY